MLVSLLPAFFGSTRHPPPKSLHYWKQPVLEPFQPAVLWCARFAVNTRMAQNITPNNLLNLYKSFSSCFPDWYIVKSAPRFSFQFGQFCRTEFIGKFWTRIEGQGSEQVCFRILPNFTRCKRTLARDLNEQFISSLTYPKIKIKKSATMSLAFKVVGQVSREFRDRIND